MIPAILLSILLLLSSTAHSAELQKGDAAPDFTLKSMSSEYVSLGDYEDNILVFIYMKPGHKRSVLALKDAMKLSGSFSDKGVRFVAITADADSKEAMEQLAKENAIDFPMLFDIKRKVYGKYGIRVYPTTVIIDKGGTFSYVLPGHPLTYLSVLEGHIRMTLGEIDKDALNKLLSPVKEEVDEAALEAERLYNLAMKFADSGLLSQAVDTAARAVETKPDIAKPHILLGFLQLQNKETDMALDNFNKALELKPGSKDAQTGLGEAYILKGELDKAIETLDTARALNPYSQMAYYYLGYAYELKGEKEKAIEMYKTAVKKIFKKKILPSSVAKCK